MLFFVFLVNIQGGPPLSVNSAVAPLSLRGGGIIGITLVAFIIVSACDSSVDETALIQDFDRVAKADSAAVSDKSRKGRGASGHARVLDYLSFNPDGGLDRTVKSYEKLYINGNREI